MDLGRFKNDVANATLIGGLVGAVYLLAVWKRRSARQIAANIEVERHLDELDKRMSVVGRLMLREPAKKRS